MSKKVSVGDTVWILWLSYRRNESRPLQEGVVSKVGREYFYAHGKGLRPDMAGKFHLDSFMSYVEPNDNGSYRSRVYLNPEELEKERDDAAAIEKVASFFRDYSWRREITADQARRITTILEEKSREQK